MTRFIISSLAALAVAAATTSAASPAFMYNATVDRTVYNNTTMAGAPLGSFMTGGTGHMMVTVEDGTLNKTVVCSVPLGSAGATCNSRARWVLAGTNYWGDQPIASNSKNSVFFVNLQNHDDAANSTYNTAIFSRTNGAEYQIQRTYAGENSWAVDFTAGAEHYYLTTGTPAQQTIIAVAYGNSSAPKELFRDNLQVTPGTLIHDVNALTDSTVMYTQGSQLYFVNGLTASAPGNITNPVANVTTMHSRNLQGNSVAVYGKCVPWVNGVPVPSTYFCIAVSSNAALQCLVAFVDGDVIPEFTLLNVWASNTMAGFANIKTATGSILLSIPLTAAGPPFQTFTRTTADAYNLPVALAQGGNTVLITVGGQLMSFNVLTQTVVKNCTYSCVGTPATRISAGVTRVVCPDMTAPSRLFALDFETCAVAWTQQLAAPVHATAQCVFAIPVSADPYVGVATTDGTVYTLAFRSAAEPAPTPAPTPAPPPAPLSTVAPALGFNITVTNGTFNQLAGPVGFGIEKGMGPLAAWSITDADAKQTVTCVAPLAAAGANCGKRPFVLSGTQWTVDRPFFVRDGGVFVSNALQGSYDPTTLLGNYTTTVVSRTNGGEMQVTRVNVGRGSAGATQLPSAQEYYTTTNGTMQNFLAIGLNGSATGKTLWKDTLNDLRSGAVHDIAVSGEYVHFIQGTTIYTLNATTGSTVYSHTVERATEVYALRTDYARSDSVIVYGAMPSGIWFAGMYVAGEGMAWMTQSGGATPVAENFQMFRYSTKSSGQWRRAIPLLAISKPSSTNTSVLIVIDVTFGNMVFNVIRSLGDAQNFPVHLGNNSYGFTNNGKWVVRDDNGAFTSKCSFGCAGAVAVRGFIETGDLRVGCALYNDAATVVAFDGVTCAVAWQASLGALASQNIFSFVDFDAPNVVAPEPFIAVTDTEGVMYSLSFRATGEPAPTPRPATTPVPVAPAVTPAPADNNKKSNGGAIAGAIIGSLLAVAVGGALYYKLKQRRRASMDGEDFQVYQSIS